MSLRPSLRPHALTKEEAESRRPPAAPFSLAPRGAAADNTAAGFEGAPAPAAPVAPAAPRRTVGESGRVDRTSEELFVDRDRVAGDLARLKSAMAAQRNLIKRGSVHTRKSKARARANLRLMEAKAQSMIVRHGFLDRRASRAQKREDSLVTTGAQRAAEGRRVEKEKNVIEANGNEARSIVTTLPDHIPFEERARFADRLFKRAENPATTEEDLRFDAKRFIAANRKPEKTPTEKAKAKKAEATALDDEGLKSALKPEKVTPGGQTARELAVANERKKKDLPNKLEPTETEKRNRRKDREGVINDVGAIAKEFFSDTAAERAEHDKAEPPEKRSPEREAAIVRQRKRRDREDAEAAYQEWLHKHKDTLEALDEGGGFGEDAKEVVQRAKERLRRQFKITTEGFFLDGSISRARDEATRDG